MFPGSSAVEQPAVNRLVAGSNPARGANKLKWLVTDSIDQNCQKTSRGHVSGHILQNSADRKKAAVPTEPLWNVFTPAIVANLHVIKSPSDYLRTRLAILSSGGLNPSLLNRELRAFKAAWEAYLTAAFSIGLFEGPDGLDLRARLTGEDDNNHLSAISECFAAWYLAGRRRLDLKPRPAGDSRSRLEFLIQHPNGDINVEVKAPHRPVAVAFWWGDDSDLLDARSEGSEGVAR